MAASSQDLALRDALLKQAALVDDFLPRDLLHQVLPADHRDDIMLQAKLMSALREKCTTRGEKWQLRPLDRRKVLGQLAGDEALPDTEISSALKGQSIYTPEQLEQMVQDGGTTEKLSTAVAALEHAGPAAPGHTMLMALSSRLEHQRKAEATIAALGDGFVGRQSELSQLIDTIDNPQRDGPVRTLHIQGLPGVGKTYLLEEITRLSRERSHIVLIRLDFDRSAFSLGNTDAIFGEISRQIGTAIPSVAAELHDIRMRSSGRGVNLTRGQALVPFDLLHRMIEILAENDRQMLLVVDTVEVLHGHGGTFVHKLLEDLDRFADKGRVEISMISAGRGTIFDEGDKRLRGLIRLEKLDAEVAHAILAKRGVPTAARSRIVALSGGNPLRLVLVARALHSASEMELSDADLSAAENGYLYRAILSRVPIDLRVIAAEGLILREIGTWELEAIIAPAVKIEMDASRAQHLLEQLEQQRWMIKPSGNGRLAQKEDVRREILELTYAESPVVTRRINELAARAYAEKDPVLALYHQLQLVRDGGDLPDIDPAQARHLTQNMMEDLPVEAQDAILRVLGQRSRNPVTSSSLVDEGPTLNPQASPPSKPVLQVAAARAQRDGIWVQARTNRNGSRLTLVQDVDDPVAPDPGGLADLRNMLEAGERREASFVMKHVFARPFRLEGEAAQLALTHQWQSGHWSMAKTLFNLLSDDDLHQMITSGQGVAVMSLLEIWAEFRIDDLSAKMTNAAVSQAVHDAVALSQRMGLQQGALSFVQAPSEDAAQSTIIRRYTSEQPKIDPQIIHSSNAIRAEFGLFLKAGEDDPGSLPPALFGQAIAPLNPYANPLRALIEDLSEDPTRKVLRDIAALGTQLSQLGSLFAPNLEGAAQTAARAGSSANEAVDMIAALGLTAELSGGYAFYSPIADLPTIARAAQRWQRASLGQWSYGAHRPDDWNEVPTNPMIQQNADNLLAAGDPVGDALAMLRIWDDPAGASDPKASKMHSRQSKAFATMAQDPSLEARLTRLSSSNVPTVLQAPLAVLSYLNFSNDEIF
ncbi:MAG: ATP-binding protein [Sulfitobacter sp.]